MEFNTRKFEAAHGKLPRGNGCWGFCPDRRYSCENYLDFCFWFSGSYSDAKKAAAKHFVVKSERFLTVCP